MRFYKRKKIMNRKKYIQEVKKKLNCSRTEKEEILRDLNEIFDSAAEHGESEAAVMNQLGKPQDYVEALGCLKRSEPMSGKRKAAIAVAGTGLAVSLYCLIKSRMVSIPDNVIGGADAMTMIVLKNTSSINSSIVFAVIAAVCVLVLLFLLRKGK